MTVLYVAGLARCGTSLMMRLLEAGGIPCVGSAPDWEVDELNHKPVSRAFLAASDGKALKLLDPLHARVPCDVPAYCLWLDRDTREQAKSHAKFLHQFGGIPKLSRHQIRGLEVGIRRDTAPNLAVLSHCATLRISFEDLISGPVTTARRIADFLRPQWPSVNEHAMPSWVVSRSSRCALDLTIEHGFTQLALLRERRTA